MDEEHKSKKKEKKYIKKGLKKLNYFNSGLNQSNSDHVFWSKYSLFGLRLDQYKNQKNFEKKENGLQIDQTWAISSIFT